MRLEQTIRFAVVAMLSALACGGARSASAQLLQQQETDRRWHLNGSLGFDFNKNDQEILQTGAESQQLNPMGDVRVNTVGFLLDPNFLRLNATANIQRGANQNDLGASSSDGLGLAGGFVFLPRSRVPLRLNYSRMRASVGGYGLEQTNNTSRLDIGWTTELPKLPHLDIGFQHDSNEVVIPSSASDVSFVSNSLHAFAHDTWKGWHWGGGFSMFLGSSTPVRGAETLGSFSNDGRALTFSTSRSFWGGKAVLAGDARQLRQSNQLGNSGEQASTESAGVVSLSVTHTQKLTSNYSYTVTHVDFDSRAGLTTPAGASILVTPTMLSQAASAGVSYAFTNWLRSSGQVQYAFTRPPDETREFTDRTLQVRSSLSAQRTWHGVTVNGAVGRLYNYAGTNFDASNGAWSNDVNGRVSWGRPDQVRLTGTYLYSRNNVVQQIGGFAEQNRGRFDLETGLVPGLQLRLGVERGSTALLNLSGKTEQDNTGYTLQIEHRRFSLAFNHNIQDGAGALFPGALLNQQALIFNLPLEQLLNTPLLDRTTVGSGVSASLRLIRRLDLNGSWRKEKSLIFSSRQDYRAYDVHAHYRLGKITLDAGVTNFLTEMDLLTQATARRTGSDLNRFYFRIGRDFTIF